jgi:group I intron endonuclease
MGNRFASGIYSIKQVSSGHLYVGSSNNIETRWRKHRAALIRNKHHSVRLQRSWNKYGDSDFLFSIVLLCDTDNLKMYEQIAIDGLNPEFNMSRSATAPVHRGQKLPKEWVENVAKTVRARYASGFKIIHPPRSDEFKAAVSRSSIERWQDTELRSKMTDAIRASMTDEERAKKSQRIVTLWENPEYRIKAVNARKGNHFAKGNVCTPEQVKNRQKAARISNMKRNYGEEWKVEYVRRYPEHIGDVNGK